MIPTTISVPARDPVGALLRQAKVLAKREAEERHFNRFCSRDIAAGIPALRRLVACAQSDSGQSARVAAFIIGCYNGRSFPVDLTSLRWLDLPLSDDILAVLALYRWHKQEVHLYVEDGEAIFQKLIKDWSFDATFREQNASSL